MRIALPSGTAAEIARPDTRSGLLPSPAADSRSGLLPSPAADSRSGLLPSPAADQPAEPGRGLVLIPDIMGLRPLVDELCARLAREQGLVVVAPEPFPDLEDRPLEWRLQHLGEVTDARRLIDIVDAAGATGQDDVAVLGFCMGGMYALKASGTGRFRRAVSFYGMIRVPEAWRHVGAIEPLDAVRTEGACPVLELAGTADSFVPEADLEALEAAGGTVVRYPGADHGFVHDPSRPTHRADDAADAWRRALAFLASP